MDANTRNGGESSILLRRRARLSLAFVAVLCPLLVSGCAMFSKDKSSDDKKAAEGSVFESQRSEEGKMSDFVASAGRKNPKEKKNVSLGETFLLSDKAKEIYANTER